MHTPHGDNHDLWINPNDPQLMVQSNDGGATVTLNGGRTWSTLYNQPTAEIYQVYVDNQFPYRLYGAQQDNSTLIVPSLPLTSGRPDSPMQEWRTGPGCETGPIFPHLTNPDTVYGSCKGQFSRMRMSSGSEKQYWVGAQSLYGNAAQDLIYRFQRVSPMEFSPHDPHVVYYGSQYLHRTRDEGVTWERISPDLTANPPGLRGHYSGEPITVDGTGEEMYSTLYAIRESTLEKGVIWTGSNDGPFHVTRDDGKTWKDVTPKNQPAGCRVQNIEPSPHRRGAAYYAVLCYLLGDFQPYLWRTDDYGASWTLLTDGTNGIAADEPTRVVREDPKRAGLLYAGTEFGMYVSFDNGARWRSFQGNLPHTPVTDMKVHHDDLVLSTQGRAFWILDDLTALHQFTAGTTAERAHLFAPRDAVRMRYAGSFGGIDDARSDPANPEYPPVGAMIDYWLAPALTGPVTLEILGAHGTVLRSYSSAGAGAAAGAGTPQLGTVRSGTRLPRSAGMNRFTWDLTIPGPWSPNASSRSRAGLTVVPGRYQGAPHCRHRIEHAAADGAHRSACCRRRHHHRRPAGTVRPQREGARPRDRGEPPGRHARRTAPAPGRRYRRRRRHPARHQRPARHHRHPASALQQAGTAGAHPIPVRPHGAGRPAHRPRCHRALPHPAQGTRRHHGQGARVARRPRHRQDQGRAVSSRALRWAAVLGAAAFVLAMPRPDGITVESWRLLAIFTATIVGSIAQPIPPGAVVFLGIGAIALFRVMPPRDALAGFADPIVWLVLCAFFMSRGVIKTASGAASPSCSFAPSGNHRLASRMRSSPPTSCSPRSFRATARAPAGSSSRWRCR